MSHIRHTDSHSAFVGKEATDVFTAYMHAAGIRSYVKSGLKPTRTWTVAAALDSVRRITGMQFKRGQLLEAAQWLVLWGNAKRFGIAEFSTRNYDLGHQYALIRWMWDDPAEVKAVVGSARGDEIFNAIDQHALDCELVDPYSDGGVMMSNAERASRAWAVTLLAEVAREAK